MSSPSETAKAENNHEKKADVSVQLESAGDVLLGRQLNRAASEYQLSVHYQILQTAVSIGVGAQSTLGGGGAQAKAPQDIFARKYMYEKLTKFPKNFALLPRLLRL